MIFLFANVGNSDLGKGGKPVFSGERNPYERSKESYLQRDFEYEALILEPALEYLRNLHDEVQIELFATEQEPPHPQDTLYMAYILRELLRRKYGIEPRIHKIKGNPADYDEMDVYFSSFFSFFSEEMREEENLCFVSLTGGTPAENLCLLFNAIQRYESRVVAIYLPKGREEVKRLEIGNRIFKSVMKSRIEALKEKHLYCEAAELAESFGVLERKEVLVLKGKGERELFNFERAKRYFKDAIQLGSEEALRELNELKNLWEGEEYEKKRALLAEIYRSAVAKWHQGAFVDFLGRIFRLSEAALQTIFEKETGMDISKRENYDAFWEYVRNENNLRKFLEERKIILEGAPSRHILLVILRYWIEKCGKWKEYGEVYNALKCLECLIELRHRTIIGHGVEGVSKEKILDICRHKECNRYNIKGERDVFDLLRRVVNI